jgi:hypothetical protein
MRHPFDGIEGTARRTFLGTVLALGAGLFAARVAHSAAPPTPQPSTERLGEEGGPLTTLRTGEEGGPSTTAAFEEGGKLTEALHEDGRGRPIPPRKRPKDRKPTEALHEDGGTLTTLAIGEEGGK